MASNDRTNPTGQDQLTATALRQSIADSQMSKAQEAMDKRQTADRQLQELFREFLESEITQKELDDIRSRIVSATERGEMKIQVMRFSSKLCSDKGRAINSNDPKWPSTLQGKAKSFYDFFLERGRPQGFRLSAQIVDFPKGKPGDVGLIVSWSGD